MFSLDAKLRSERWNLNDQKQNQKSRKNLKTHSKLEDL